MGLVRIAATVGVAWSAIGCRQLFGIDQPVLGDGAMSGDARSDGVASDSVADAQMCFGAGLVTVCLAQLPTTPLSIPAATMINTGTSTMCVAATGAAGACVVAATTISIDATLVATGVEPLILVATSTLTVTPEGVIIAASNRNPVIQGAGSDPVECDDGIPPTLAGGGAGGSFGGAGGNGANGSSQGIGGIPGATMTVTKLRGGCAGQAVGIVSGGVGGGAVYLIANAMITVNGVIDASGESGAGGGGVNYGGTGAGAGGLIGLDAPQLDLTGAVIFANGGGGGGGGGSTGVGHDGTDPLITTANEPAPGGFHGSGGGGAGDGGDGAAATTLAQPGTTGAAGGGGGGGGGIGVVKIYGTVVHTAMVTSPPAS